MTSGNIWKILNTSSADTGLAVDTFVHIFFQIASGIKYLKAEGLVRRNNKSANIFLTHAILTSTNRFPATTRAKITDFGLSEYIHKAIKDGTVMQSIMKPEHFEATYAYLALKAFGSEKSNVIKRKDYDDDDVGYDKRRDTNALGIYFWETLTGAVPWTGVS